MFALAYMSIQVGRTAFVLIALGGTHPLSRHFQRVLSWYLASGHCGSSLVGTRHCRPLVKYKFHVVPVEIADPPDQPANLRAARARAFAASTSRFLGGALVSSEASSLLEAAVISSTAK